jgi:hypothetical protein
MNIKNCTCKTNAVLFRMNNQEEIICCLKCKIPYNLSTVSYGLTMPFKIELNGNYSSQIIINKSKYASID